MVRKALVLPINSSGQLLVQDRENYKPPRWGFFGGSIERGETPLEAVIREAKEELDLELLAADLQLWQQFVVPGEETDTGDPREYNCFLLEKDLDLSNLTVLEGKASVYVSLEDALQLMQEHSSPTDVSIVKMLIKKFNSQQTQPREATK